jgi:hypothetical protein
MFGDVPESAVLLQHSEQSSEQSFVSSQVQVKHNED